MQTKKEEVYEVDKMVGKRLKERRLFMGLSQMELSSQIGVSFQQLQKYEKGKNRISAGKLFYVAKILNTEISYFYSDEEQSQQQLNEDIFGQTIEQRKEAYQLLSSFSKIKDPKIRELIYQFIETSSKG